MRKKIYSKSQMKELENNSNVIRVTEQTITYHPEFKVIAVHENLAGKRAAQIFEEHGFNLDIVGKDIPRKRLYRWKQIYKESGELGLTIDLRGKTKSERTSSKELSVREKQKS